MHCYAFRHGTAERCSEIWTPWARWNHGSWEAKGKSEPHKFLCVPFKYIPEPKKLRGSWPQRFWKRREPIRTSPNLPSLMPASRSEYLESTGETPLSAILGQWRPKKKWFSRISTTPWVLWVRTSYFENLFSYTTTKGWLSLYYVLWMLIFCQKSKTRLIY